MTAKGPYGRKRGSIGPCRTVGERIRAIRLAWGWTQGELADRLGTKQQLLSHWERGIAEPSAAAMASLCATLNVRPEAMTTGEGFSVPDMPEDLPIPPSGKRGGRVAVQNGTNGRWEWMSLDEATNLMHEAESKGFCIWISIK